MSNIRDQYFDQNKQYSLKEIKDIAAQNLAPKYYLVLEGYLSYGGQKFVIDAVYKEVCLPDLFLETTDFEKDDGTCARPNDGDANWICVKNMNKNQNYHMSYVICASSVRNGD